MRDVRYSNSKLFRKKDRGDDDSSKGILSNDIDMSTVPMIVVTNIETSSNINAAMSKAMVVFFITCTYFLSSRE